MATVARLESGNLIIQGRINERLPAVTDGLVAHFPFDGNPDGYSNITDGLIGYYKLDGDAVDSSDYGRNGSTSNVTYATGKVGQCGSFSNSTVTIGYGTTFFPLHAFTLSAWIKTSGLGSGMTVNGILSITYGLTLFLESTGRLHFRMDTGTSLPAVTAGGSLHDNVFHHVVASFDGKNQKLYIDGNLEGTFAFTGWTGSTRWPTNNAVIGQENNNGSVYRFNGLIDDVRIYNRALSDSEVFALYLYNMPSTNANNTLTSNGVAVEEATTNILLNSNIDHAGWEKGYNSNITYHYNGPLPGRVVARFTPNTYSSYWYSYGDFAPQADGTVYTVSIWCRALETSMDISCYTADNAEAGRQWSNYVTVKPEDGWKRCIWTLPATGVPCVQDSLSFHFYCTAGKYYELSSPQMEAKPFATSFVVGGRSGGTLTIPVNIGTSDFTICGEFIPDANSDTLPNGSYFLNLGSGFILRTYNQVPYIDGNVIAGASDNNVHIDYNTTPLSRVRYMIKRGGTRFTWRMLDDNGQDITWTKVHANVPTIPVTSLSYYHTWGGVHKNVSVYNRALTDDEIAKLIKNSFSIDSKGILITNRLTEKMCDIPASSIYVPLSVNSLDYNQTIAPIAESNVAYEDGAAWIGSAVTNLYTGTSPWSNNGGTHYDVTNTAEAGPIENSKTWKLVKTGTGNQWNGWQDTYGGIFSGVTGDYWTLSGWYKTTNDAGVQYISCGGFYLSNWSRAYNTTWVAGGGTITIPDGKWHHFYGVMRLNEDMTNAIVIGGPAWNYSTQAGELYVNGIQWTKTKVPSPYVYGTRGNTTIKFDDMKLRPQFPSKKPFTYIIWFKIHPQVAAIDAPLMSCTEGGGFALALIASGAIQGWVHNGTNYPTLVSSGYDYRDNKWHMAALIAGSDDTAIYVDGKEVARSKGVMTGKDVYYGSANYNLFIGTENDNGTPSTTGLINGYVKNFLAIPVELSASQIQSIYTTWMRSYDNGELQIQGKLIEGGVL